MSAPKHPRPSFGALIHGPDAQTEVFAAERPAAPGPAPASSAYDETVVTERIRPPGQPPRGQSAYSAPDATGPAPEAAEPERVVAKFRSHGRRLFFPTILLIAIAGATGYFSGWFAEEWQNWSVLAAGALLAVLFFVIPAVKWLSIRYVLTTRRVILRRGLLVNTRTEVMFARAGDLTVRKSVLQAMFRTGDVRIGTAPGEYAVLRDVPRPDLVSEAIGDLIEAQHVPAHAVRFRRTHEDNSWWDEQQPHRAE